MFGAVVSVCSLLLAVFAWWVKNNDVKKKVKEQNDKERKDEIVSGDISAIHNRIDRLRKK